MQMCENCESYYDPSEYPYCPYCSDGAPDDYQDYLDLYPVDEDEDDNE